jgi:hypothetical protein
MRPPVATSTAVAQAEWTSDRLIGTTNRHCAPGLPGAQSRLGRRQILQARQRRWWTIRHNALRLTSTETERGIERIADVLTPP